MKTMFFLLACVFISLLLSAQQGSGKKKPILPANDGKYCVVLNGDKPVVTLNGKPVKIEVDLRNGNKLTPNGTVIKKDGTIQMIKPGSCVNTEGNEVEQAERK